MAQTLAPNVGLSYGWSRGEDFWGGPNNDNIVQMDTLLFPNVQSLTFRNPPPEVAEGQQYIVASGGIGVWAGHDGDFAAYIAGTWRFYAPKRGWRAFAESYGEFIWFNGETWLSELDGQDPVNPGGTPELKPFAYDIAATISDDMYAGEAIVRLPIIDPMILPANAVDSVISFGKPAVGFAVFRIQRNAVNVGTITVESGNYNGSFATSGGSAISFGKGDTLTVLAPAQAITGLKDFGFVIRLKIS